MGANKSFISVFGMYQYDNSIFDGFQVPEAIDKELLIDNLLLETAELEVIYPNAEFMKLAIDRWSRKELPIWNKLYDTTQFDYNPIWNKDGTIKETETRNLHTADSGSNESSSEGSSTTNQDETTTLKVAAYNSSDFENREENTIDNNVDVTDEASAESSYRSSKDDTGTIIHEREEKGNIGITTTQQMIKEEREVVQLNMMNFIIDSFKRRFCLLVY